MTTTITARETDAFIGIGSNLENPKQQVLIAIERLKKLPETHWQGMSQLYGSRPQGPQDQPDFVNAVAWVRTRLSPLALLDALQDIERTQGKVKKRHWGERLIDLDVLLYGETVIDEPRLQVPHPFMTERDFVLLPLLDLKPDGCMPDGRSFQELADRVSDVFVQPI